MLFRWKSCNTKLTIWSGQFWNIWIYLQCCASPPLFPKHFHYPKEKNLVHIKQQVPILPFPSPNHWQPPIRFFGLYEFNYHTYFIQKTKYMPFCVWIHSLSIMFSRFNRVQRKIIPSLRLIILHCMYIPLCLSINPLLAIWAASTFWLLWIG